MIFISYASADRLAAKRLADALESTGWRVWWARSISPGLPFDQAINDAIQQSACIVVLWSRSSTQSNWVLEEATDGRDRGILVPALIEAVNPPRGFRRFQAADLNGWDGAVDAPAFRLLCSSIERIANARHQFDENNKKQVSGHSSTVVQTQGPTLPRNIRTNYKWYLIGSRASTEFTLAKRHSVIYERKDLFLVQAIRFYVDDELIAKRIFLPSTAEWKQYIEIEGHRCEIYLKCQCRSYALWHKLEVRVMVEGFQVLQL